MVDLLHLSVLEHEEPFVYQDAGVGTAVSSGAHQPVRVCWSWNSTLVLSLAPEHLCTPYTPPEEKHGFFSCVPARFPFSGLWFSFSF